MLTESKVLALLQIVVPSDTALTVSSEVKILEILGIVSIPEAVNVLRLASDMVPPATPSTLKGLVQLLTGLIKLNPATTKEHNVTLTKALSNLDKIADAPLTYGTFLPICETLMKANTAKHVTVPLKSSAR
jgi:hypothetical protein